MSRLIFFFHKVKSSAIAPAFHAFVKRFSTNAYREILITFYLENFEYEKLLE